MRAYTLPERMPEETEWQWCCRAAESIPPKELVKQLLERMAKTCKKSKRPLWAMVGEATSHGSTVSAAIVHAYLPDHKDR